jgi:hypothetical protein
MEYLIENHNQQVVTTKWYLFNDIKEIRCILPHDSLLSSSNPIHYRYLNDLMIEISMLILNKYHTGFICLKRQLTSIDHNKKWRILNPF